MHFTTPDAEGGDDYSSNKERHGRRLHRRTEAYAQPAVNRSDGCHQAACHDARDLPKQDMVAYGRLPNFILTEIRYNHNQQHSAYQQEHCDNPQGRERNTHRAEQFEMVYHKTEQQLSQKRENDGLQLSERLKQVNSGSDGA